MLESLKKYKRRTFCIPVFGVTLAGFSYCSCSSGAAASKGSPSPDPMITELRQELNDIVKAQSDDVFFRRYYAFLIKRGVEISILKGDMFIVGHGWSISGLDKRTREFSLDGPKGETHAFPKEHSVCFITRSGFHSNVPNRDEMSDAFVVIIFGNRGFVVDIKNGTTQVFGDLAVPL